MSNQTVELYAHRSGFRPGEPEATHSRKRYRLTPKTEGPPCDPSLWLIHYSRADPRDHMLTNRIPLLPPVQVILSQRRALQQHGSLPRKEFMFNDKSNWPVINMPTGVTGQVFPQPNNMVNTLRQQQQAFMNQNDPSVMTGPSPNRPGAVRSHIRGPSAGIPAAIEVSLEEEEDVSRGDIMDFMTPRDIALTRYKQHHEWMEEIFASPYPTKSIVPTDLGLGRKGELDNFTKGFFHAPASRDATSTGDQLGADGEATAWAKVGKMKDGKAEEFGKRADDLLADTQMEIKRLNEAHGRRIAKLKKSDFFVTAAKKLESAPFTAEKTPGDDRETYEAIVKQVEDIYNVSVVPLDELEPVVIEKGGLLDNPVEFSTPNGNIENGSAKAQGPDAEMDEMSETIIEELQQPQQEEPEPPAEPNVPSPRPDIAIEADSTIPSLRDQLEGDTNMTGLDIEPANDQSAALVDDWVLVNDSPSKPPSNHQTPAAGTLQDQQQGAQDQPLPTEHTPQPVAGTDLTPAATGFTPPVTEEQTGTTPAELGADFDISANFDSAGDALDAYGQEHGRDSADLDLEDIGEMGDLDDSAFGQAFHP